MRKTRARLMFLAGTLAAAMAVTATVAGLAAADPSELAAVRSATAKYHNVAAAEDAGYGLFTDADGIACIDNPPLGGMGIHYVNGSYVGDAVLDPTKPEALVYAPKRNGGLKLVALEYIVFQAPWDLAHGVGSKDVVHAPPPSLFGEDFELVPQGNRYGLDPFYELHVWLWKANPSGMFFEWNPEVVC